MTFNALMQEIASLAFFICNFMLASLQNLCRLNPRNDGMLYTASSDGTVSYTDLETGISLSLTNLNPDGWQVLFYY